MTWISDDVIITGKPIINHNYNGVSSPVYTISQFSIKQFTNWFNGVHM